MVRASEKSPTAKILMQAGPRVGHNQLPGEEAFRARIEAGDEVYVERRGGLLRVYARESRPGLYYVAEATRPEGL